MPGAAQRVPWRAPASRWSARPARSTPRLYRLALESARPGTRWHAADDEDIPIREIAKSIGHHLGLPTASIPADQLGEHFGFLAPVIVLDSPVSTEETRRTLGWEPTHPGLLADFGTGDYFTTGPNPAAAH